MNQLHIVIYSELKPFGGGRETWLAYFLDGVKHKFHKIYVYALAKNGESTGNLLDGIDGQIYGVYHDSISIPPYLKRTKDALENNLQNGDVCLMVGSVVEGMLAPWLRKKYGDSVRRIIWVRSIAAREVSERHQKVPYRLISMLEKRNLRAANTVITNGLDTLAYYETYWPSGKSKLCYIGNAVRAEQYKCKRDWKNIDQVKIVFVGRIAYIKGASVLVELTENFQSRYPELVDKCIVEVWGEGTLQNIHDNRILHLKGKASREQVPHILKHAHIELFLTPSNTKGPGGLSHSLLEGLASGCICVCSDINAYRQVVNETNGVLVDSSDINKVSDQLASLIQDCLGKECEKISALSQNAVQTGMKHSVEHHICEFMRLLSE